MRATIVAILAAGGLLAAGLPIAMPASASEGELATAHLAESASDGSRRIQFDGVSRIHLAGLCLPGGGACIGTNDTEDGRFFLPASGTDGRVVVWWSAANHSLRQLRVTVGDRVVEGASPLELDVGGASAGEYTVRAESTRLVAGIYDQDVFWSASFAVDGPPAEVHHIDRSGYASITGCVLVVCDQTIEQRSARFVSPWNASGTLTGDWDAREGARRMSIRGTGLVVEGPPPLTLDIRGLGAGEWPVDVAPVLAAGALSESWVTWQADLVAT